MKHDDETLQAAIDAAMIENKTKVRGPAFVACPKIYPTSWASESQARLDLAKSFLAKLPEPQPILAHDGRSLGQVAKEAFIGAPGLTDDWMNAAAQAVASVALAQVIKRMEEVSHSEITNAYWQEGDGYENIRARLIAAARGETEQQADSTDLREALKIANESADEQMRYKREAEARAEKAETERKKWEEDALRYCKNADYWKARAEKAESEAEETRHEAEQFREECHADMVGFRDRAEKAEAELTALKSSPIGILRPLAEAGPVPDRCVRINGHFYADRWYLGWQKDDKDTHFADIRIPSTETPAPVNEPPMQQVPLGPEDVMPGSVIRGRNWALDWGKCWLAVLETTPTGVHCNRGNEYRFTSLQYVWQINRSIPLTGKWDATAWEPCSKPAK